MKATAKETYEIMEQYVKAKLVPFIVGSPGVGKSALVKKLADNYCLKVIDLRLAQCDPTDLGGFPSIQGKKATYLPMDTFPIEGDAVPEGYEGWLLFLDEFNSASAAVQAAAYKIVLDHMVGQNKLHRNVIIVCAGNLETDNAIVQPMSTALQSRLAHIQLEISPKEWVEWANEAGFDHKLTSYIEFKPTSLFSFNPEQVDDTYACPRTWEFANRLLKVVDLKSKHVINAFAGVLSEGVAREFIGYCKIFADLPKMVDIETNPLGVLVPNEPSILFALTGALAHNATDTNMANLIKYINRMPIEFQIVTLRGVIHRNRKMVSNPNIKDWLRNSAVTLF